MTSKSLFRQLMDIENVYEILLGLYNQSKDPVYDICPLFKQEYLANQQHG